MVDIEVAMFILLKFIAVNMVVVSVCVMVVCLSKIGYYTILMV